VLILDVASSEYYSLNDVGTAMWELMAEGHTLEKIVAEVCARYDVAEAQVRADLVSLVDELQEKRLITVRTKSTPPAQA
jgi:hypothetical protein